MFKLAGHLGKTVGELKKLLSYQDLIDWIAYDRLDPIGSYRQDINTALLAYMQSGDKDAKLTDFILIDPDPVAEEVIKHHEYERQQIEREASKQRLINMFDGLCE